MRLSSVMLSRTLAGRRHRDGIKVVCCLEFQNILQPAQYGVVGLCGVAALLMGLFIAPT